MVTAWPVARRQHSVQLASVINTASNTSQQAGFSCPLHGPEQGQAGQQETRGYAARIAHEQPRGRPVPGQETQLAGGQQQAEQGVLVRPALTPGQQRRRTAGEQALDRRDAVDAIHEIIEIHQP